MAVSTRVDISGSVAKLKAVQNPNFSILDDALEEAFAQTQEHVHVITGALRNSGSITKRGTNQYQWQGTIAYGGDSITDDGRPWDVWYADIERSRGGSHDFLNVPAIDDFAVNFTAVLEALA